MSVVVQKYGGTSVGTVDAIQTVAKKISERILKGDQVAVVVSAMAGETDRLFRLAHTLAPQPDRRELDALMATGEQVAAALLVIALKQVNCDAISFSGSQIPIRTDSDNQSARIRYIVPQKVQSQLDLGKVVVVTGFQGVDDAGNVTTLGRGGSDLTAVALAIAMGADACEIYTDVEGVFTADPRLCPEARHIQQLTFEEMLELSHGGAKVLHARSVDLARRHLLPIWVGHAHRECRGTWVKKEEVDVEAPLVSAVTSDRSESRVNIVSIQDISTFSRDLFKTLGEEKVLVNVIVQNQASQGRSSLSFTVKREDVEKVSTLLSPLLEKQKGVDVHVQEKIATLSVVGYGMKTHSSVASRVFAVLADHGIDLYAVSTSEIKISCLIPDEHAQKAIGLIHKEFGLAKEPH